MFNVKRDRRRRGRKKRNQIDGEKLKGEKGGEGERRRGGWRKMCGGDGEYGGGDCGSFNSDYCGDDVFDTGDRNSDRDDDERYDRSGCGDWSGYRNGDRGGDGDRSGDRGGDRSGDRHDNSGGGGDSDRRGNKIGDGDRNGDRCFYRGSEWCSYRSGSVFVPYSLLFLTLSLIYLASPIYANHKGSPKDEGSWKAMGVTFQEDGRPSTSTFLRYLDVLPSLDRLTVCFRLMLLQARQEIMIVSYAKENHDNELYVGLNYEKQELMLTCCGHKWSRDVKVHVPLRQWSAYCVALNLRTRRTEVVQDGGLQVGVVDSLGSNLTGLGVSGGGSMYIGQEQDTLAGGFNEFQSLRGTLLDLRIYDSFLPTTDMETYTLCAYTFNLPMPIIDFTNITRDFEVGEVDITEIEVPSLCDQNEAFDLVFPEMRLFHEGELLCRILGGALKLPLSRKANSDLFIQAAPYASGCGDGIGDTLWLGLRANISGQSWHGLNSITTLNFTNFAQKNGLPIEEPEVCVTFKGSRDIVPSAYGTWVPRPCNIERCIACHFSTLPYVRIRGLCAKSEFDRKYFLIEVNSTVGFSGVYYSLLTKHPPNKNKNNTQIGDFGFWRISRYDKPYVTATLPMRSPTHYPTGLNTWIINNDVCGATNVTLRMTSCKDQEFSCDDGTCIRLHQRCNMEVNCPDGSDEKSCSFLVLPDGYNPMTPPPRADPSSPINVYLHINMLSVRAFDLTGFKFVCELEVRITWNDNRVIFHHLNDAEYLNTIYFSDDEEKQKPWMPTVEFFGDAFTTSDVEVRRSLLVAKRATEPLPDNDENLVEDEVFAGRDNPFVLIKKLTVTTSCQFDLITFPFDTQKCTLGVVLLGLTEQYITLVPERKGVEFLGKRKLLEYYLASEVMLPYKYGEDYSGQAVEMTFQNLSTFYITSTYVPTFIIVIIGYLVFYFPVEDFNERIMVALTALLVEAAFFTQMSATIPQTAYLKLVDVWFVFCIISLFLVVVTVAFINWCKKCAPACVLRVGAYSRRNKEQLNLRRSALAAWLNLLCRLVCPLLTILFLVFYLVMAALIEIPKLDIQLTK